MLSITTGNTSLYKEQKAADQTKLRVAHLNVLRSATPFEVWATDSKIRFRAIATTLIASLGEDSDVFCFNESCTAFEDELLSQLRKQARPFWYITNAPSGRDHYVSILSFLPPVENHTFALSERARDAVAILVSKAGNPALVVATHLQAYENDDALRAVQLRNLCAAIDKSAQAPSASELLRDTVLTQRRFCILGDFNLHQRRETGLLADLGLVDVYRLIHGGSEAAEAAGITWESSTLWWLPFDDRRMRLDRVVLPNGCVNMRPTSCEIIAQSLIPGTKLRCSDHFGLLTEFALGRNGAENFVLPPLPYVPNPLEQRDPKGTGGRTIQQIVTIRILVSVAAAAVVAGLGALLVSRL